MIGPQFPDEAPPVVTGRTLRQFAGLCLGIFGGLFAWSGYQHHGAPTASAWIALGVALVVGLPGLLYPSAIRPVFLGASALTQPIGHAISTVLLGLIYYALITPLAFLFRIAGRDPLARRSLPLETYWEPKVEPGDVRRYLRQYQSQSRDTPAPLTESIMGQPESVTENEDLLQEASNPGFFADFWDFLTTSKKWWMLPLLIVFLLLGVVLVLAHTAAAPFIYTLF